MGSPAYATSKPGTMLIRRIYMIQANDALFATRAMVNSFGLEHTASLTVFYFFEVLHSSSNQVKVGGLCERFTSAAWIEVTLIL